MLRMESLTLDSLPAELVKAKEALGSWDALAIDMKIPVRYLYRWKNGKAIGPEHLQGVLDYLGLVIQRPSPRPAVIQGGRSSQPTRSARRASIGYLRQRAKQQRVLAAL